MTPGAIAGARLVLFDIDGTLLRTGNHVHGRAILQAGREVTGIDLTQFMSGVDAGGPTDRYIMGELLRRAGFGPADVDRHFAAIAELACELTGAGLSEPSPEWALPGAREVLDAFTVLGTALGLVTGNLPRIAELKLTCAGLWDAFAGQRPLITGFGHLSEDRNDLTRAALVQAQAELDAAIAGEHVLVIGDTPRDVECARAIGAACVAVATGRFSVDQLRALGDDVFVVASLEELLPFGLR